MPPIKRRRRQPRAALIARFLGSMPHGLQACCVASFSLCKLLRLQDPCLAICKLTVLFFPAFWAAVSQSRHAANHTFLIERRVTQAKTKRQLQAAKYDASRCNKLRHCTPLSTRRRQPRATPTSIPRPSRARLLHCEHFRLRVSSAVKNIWNRKCVWLQALRADVCLDESSFCCKLVKLHYEATSPTMQFHAIGLLGHKLSGCMPLGYAHNWGCKPLRRFGWRKARLLSESWIATKNFVRRDCKYLELQATVIARKKGQQHADVRMPLWPWSGK